MIKERYAVNIYFLVVFYINVGVTCSSLLAGGVFCCPSGLSCFTQHCRGSFKNTQTVRDSGGGGCTDGFSQCYIVLGQLELAASWTMCMRIGYSQSIGLIFAGQLANETHKKVFYQAVTSLPGVVQLRTRRFWQTRSCLKQRQAPRPEKLLRFLRLEVIKYINQWLLTEVQGLCMLHSIK